MISVCCHERAFLARSGSGWWIDGKLVHEWYECGQCKRPCELWKEQRNEGIEGNEQTEFSEKPLSA